jgi:hypothetical protein
VDQEHNARNSEPYLPSAAIGHVPVRYMYQLEQNGPQTQEAKIVHVEVTKLSDGLGIGEGSISGGEIGKAAGAETMTRVDQAINSPNILVPVGVDGNGKQVEDDGCGDGRFTALVKKGRDILKRSLHRAKVFGGGATMATADRIGAGDTANMTLEEVFAASMDYMTSSQIDFGAHTGHSGNGECGCGAIDKAPIAVAFVAKYRDTIGKQFEALGVSTDGLAAVFDNFAAYAERIQGQSFQGRNVMEMIIDVGKIVKELGGPHKEARIVLNHVRGMTVNQQLVREASGGEVDIFAVDVWRMQDLAVRLHPNDEVAQTRAFQSMLAYTLAVAAVLTKGDLPVYAVQMVADPASELVTV